MSVNACQRQLTCLVTNRTARSPLQTLGSHEPFVNKDGEQSSAQSSDQQNEEDAKDSGRASQLTRLISEDPRINNSTD
jgi:hypothetical protein